MRNFIKWIFLLILAGFFLVAGFLKVIDPVEFMRAILRYQLFPPVLAWIAALWVPWLEIAAALGLLLRSWRQAAAGLIILLLVAFEVLLGSAAYRGLNIDCGCLGTGAESSIQMALLRNLGLLLAAIILIILERQRK